jgi:hypothetical protein
MKTKIFTAIIGAFLLFSCDQSFEDLNYNQNAITTEELISPQFLIKGTMLADISINESHIQRISGMWSGQYKGALSLYLGLYNYDISSEESNSSWTYLYNGILKQNREISKYYVINGMDAKGQLITAISKIIEANAVGTATSNWGDIPYSEAAIEGIDDPKFDKQSEVYVAIQKGLDEAIALLDNARTSKNLKEDIFFYTNDGTDTRTKWKEVAYTLKARYYLQTKQYPLAYTAAQKGISAHAGTMRFTPPAEGLIGTENLLYRFMTTASRRGFMLLTGTFCSEQLLNTTTASTFSRNNAKTTETARRTYLRGTTNGSIGSNSVINGELTPMNLVTYQENLLILAETGARTVSFAEGLTHLNKVRAFLLTTDAFVGLGVRKYDAYTAGDFVNGGIENKDNINQTRALLREIIEERYVTGFGTFIPWDDARRLRKTDADIAVPIPLNNSTATKHPERFIISQNEINANSNAPKGLTIYDVTEVNQ